MASIPKITDPDALHAYLLTLPAGPIQETDELSAALAHCWSQLSGGTDTNMSSMKLHRLESPMWEPPCLTFWMERHGRTVNGSSRGDLHQWTVNFESRTAKITARTYRQLSPQAPRLNVKPLVDDLIQAILDGKPNDGYLRRRDGNIKILVGKVVPNDAAQQTMTGRRRRFSEYLELRAAALGWERIGQYIFDIRSQK